MKTAVSMGLSLCLVWAPLPVAAQKGILATPGPVAGIVTRAAVRLAVTGEPTPSGGEAVQQGDKPAESNRARARKLAPGAEVIVTVQGSQYRRRYFVLADESNLTVLNLTDPTLPRSATRGLRDMASDHPEWFTGAHKGVLQNKDVRVGSDGVFVADRKVADLDKVVETISWTEVFQIKKTVDKAGIPTGAAVAIGAAAALAGVIIVLRIFAQQ